MGWPAGSNALVQVFLSDQVTILKKNVKKHNFALLQKQKLGVFLSFHLVSKDIQDYLEEIYYLTNNSGWKSALALQLSFRNEKER